MKFIWKHRKTRIWFVITALMLTIMLAVSVVLVTVPIASNSLSLIWGGERANIVEDHRSAWYDREYQTKVETLTAARDLVVDIAREGIILLKNQEKALPLTAEEKLTVFGKNSVNLVYGGSGSAGNLSATTKDLYHSLDAAKITYNPVIRAFYEDKDLSGNGRPSNPSMDSGQRLAGFATGETPMSCYTKKVRDSYAQYGDVALVLISRIGGEGFDLPRTMATDFDMQQPVSGASSVHDHYLQLDLNEQAMIEEAKANFDKVILVLNTGTTMELGALQEDEGIDAILWMGLPGSTGVMALGEILLGKSTDGLPLSPSGRTVDTWVRDFTKDPTWFNSGVYGSQYGNRYLQPDGEVSPFAFVNYDEGIYVGYRYYETRGYEETRINPSSTWYADAVVYPFGYGLSYTNFDWQVAFAQPDAVISADDTLKVDVTVTNTGDFSAREVVQLYYSPPYTPGGIEKAHVVLGAFEKTDVLAPGETQTLKLSLPVNEMKSYDYADMNENGFSGYELEKGKYTLMVGTNAHETVAQMTYTVEEDVLLPTLDDAQGNNVKVTNRFDDVSAGIFGNKTTDSYVTRADFAGTLPQSYLADSERTLSNELEAALKQSIKRTYSVPDEGQPWQVNEKDSPPTHAVNNDLSLRNMLQNEQGELTGKVDFDDPRWDALLDQIPLDEMKLLVGYGAFRTNAVEGVDGIVDKPLTRDSDGPSGFTSFLSESVVYDTCFYQAEMVLASSWNTGLALRMGRMVGEEGLVGNEKDDGMPYSGWYAPAVNIHRSQFGGRNWEYYSEDGLLSGRFAAKVIQGAADKGVYTYVKHFAVNDQETDREYNGILVWANEQSMRELYLKPFEMAVKEGGARGMMTSFNRLGLTWAGGSYPLLTQILRNEWGFRGMVITDYSMNRYTYVDQMIRAGGDLFLTQDSKNFQMPDDATQLSLLRQATKNIMYVTANSNVMSVVVDGYKPPLWHTWLLLTALGIILLLALWGVLAIRTAKKAPVRAKKRIE